MADVLVDFLNHGALPFVGRQIEQGRILRFWSDRGDERFALETLLLTGEAGIGKSRLIEETIPLVEARKGGVIHVKLRPEGATSLIPLIVLGIERSESARSLFRTLPSPNYSAALGALRRLCALRRTLLIIEDIHLLEGPSLHEFALLLEGLRDESLGLIAATRPIDSPAIDILEAYITDEIRLEGLDTEAIEELWYKLFKDRTSSAMSGMLKETTHGNALALRSALRGGVRVGSLKQRGSGERLELQIEPAAFRESARRAARAVVTGMIANLDSELLKDACRLALLGEVFSYEAAAEMVENVDEVIPALTFKGILTRTTTASAPINTESHHTMPISFTHSLVHDDLLEEAPESIERIVRVLASGGPVYTYLPYRMIRETTGRIDLPGEVIARAVESCCTTTRLVNIGTDWRNASIPLEAAEKIALSLPEDFDPEKRRLLTAILLWARLDISVRRELDDHHKNLAEQLLDLASLEPVLVNHRLIALEHLIRNATELGRGDGREIFEETVAFADRNIEARRAHRYIQFLYVVATSAHNRDDRSLLDRLEKIILSILDEGILEEEQVQQARKGLIPSFLVLVRTKEELDYRIGILEELKKLIRPLTPDITQREISPYFHIQSFYLTTGEIDPLIELGARFAPILQSHGLRQSYYLTRRWNLLAQCLVGNQDARDIELWRRLIDEIDRDGGLSDSEKERLKASVIRSYHTLSYMLGDLELMTEVLEKFSLPFSQMHISNQLVQTLWHGDYEGFLGVSEVLPPERLPLARVIAFPPEDEEEIVEQMVEHLRDRPWDIFQFVSIHLTVDILDRAIEMGHITNSPALREEVRAGLLHTLEHLFEKRMPLLMEPIIRRYGHYFSRNECRAWKERIDGLTETRRQLRAPRISEQVVISMFDAITIRTPGNDVERLRGGRSATLLGLLVANRMLKYPLDRIDFFAFASGVENDPDRARTATNVAILRLREVIGRETILTGNDLPELNDRLAHVDLIEVWNALERGEKELHGGHLLNAREAAREAVAIATGRIPFPGLYDELFERLREDLETRLRDLVFRVAGRLADADDHKEAEELLRAWNDRVPGDEEALDMLAHLLERSGERAEAVAIRSRGMMVG